MSISQHGAGADPSRAKPREFLKTPQTTASSSALVWAKVSLRTPGPVPILSSVPLSGSDRSLHSTRILVGIMSWRGTTRNTIQSECVHGKAFLYDTFHKARLQAGEKYGTRKTERRT